jgi:uncharacterized protein (DUF169 family)
MEGQPNAQESKQEIIEQIRARLEAFDTEIDSFLEKSAAADTYNKLLHLQVKTPALGDMNLKDLEVHPDVIFFKRLLKLKELYEEELGIEEQQD